MYNLLIQNNPYLTVLLDLPANFISRHMYGKEKLNAKVFI